jgi:hypothetical protein
MAKAFEPEKSRRLPWHSDGWQDEKRFFADITTETTHARTRFNFPGAHLDNETHSKEYWLSVINEEMGKLSQAVNKLHIVSDDTIRQQWVLEGWHRILTASSLLRRFAENWEKT